MVHLYPAIFVVMVIVSVTLVTGDVYKSVKLTKKDYKVKEKDLKQAKARWIQVQRDYDWGDDMMQKPIDEAPRRSNRELGEICTYSRDCSSGCCLMDRETKLRSCQSKSKVGQKCSSAQVKADLFVDACPCVSGYNYCSYPQEVCTK